MNLRKPINEMCRSCIYDNLAAGTWRQQVTLCPVKSCALYKVRPQTKSAVPDSVLTYYGIKSTNLKDIAFEEGMDTENPNCSSQVVKLATSQDSMV